MRCSRCYGFTKVVETRPTHGVVRRWRECKQCGHRFTTLEVKKVQVRG